MSILAVNPYAGKTFFGFWVTLIQRVGGVCLGDALASDEIQLLVLILLSFSLAFLGTLLVLRQMTMLANALSHTVLLGVVVAYLLYAGKDAQFLTFSSLWVAALVAGGVTTLCTEGLKQGLQIQEDASIGLVFTTLFALGVVLVTVFTKNVHLGVEALMGNIDALGYHDLRIMGGFACLIVLCEFLLARGFFVSFFDGVFAKSIGFPVKGLGFLSMLLAAGGAVAAFRAVGVLLFLAFLVGPVLIARQWVRSFFSIVWGSAVVGIVASLCAVSLARHLLTVYQMPLSTSGLLVTILLGFYVLSLLLSTCVKKNIRPKSRQT